MKLLTVLAALMLLTVPATAAGFHDDPNVRNCSILGRFIGITDCEWVAMPVSKSMIAHTGHPSCPAGEAWTDNDGDWSCVAI